MNKFTDYDDGLCIQCGSASLTADSVSSSCLATLMSSNRLTTGATVDVRALIEKGQAKQNADHAEREKAKVGILRGGSAGCVGTDGLNYGECPRVALLRLKGVDKEVEANRHIMFTAGLAAEDSWAAKLTAAGVTFRREEEIQITWPVPGHPGRVVTGRPDIVIMDGEAPAFGLELKGIYSAGSAVRVECEGIPDPKHLAQAGFYSMALGIDYAICYTNPSVWDVPYWAKEARAAGRKKLQPFYRMFYLRWGDTLEYRDEKAKHWVPTVYTKAGIAAYYVQVLDMENGEALVDRPEGGYATGEALPYSKCKYCPFSAACDMYDVDKSVAGWLENCKNA